MEDSKKKKVKLEERSIGLRLAEVGAPRIQVSDQGGTVIDGLDDISDDDYLRKVGTCLVTSNFLSSPGCRYVLLSFFI